MKEKQIKINNNFAFLGSSTFSVFVLEKLKSLDLLPLFIITTPDKPIGRKQILTENVVKKWAKENNIKVFSPDKLNKDFIEILKKENISKDQKELCPVFLVASYGKLIPEELINIPSKGTLNIHPSLLPKYRGPSPLPETIIKDEKETGITIMQIDAEMDHGPIIAYKNIKIDEWMEYEVFEKFMAEKGAELFAEIFIDWLEGKIIPKEQNHKEATYTKKIEKSFGKIILEDNHYDNWRKYLAYHKWPQTYFEIDHKGKKIRIKITSASYNQDIFKIEKVIPEGAKEMDFDSFYRGYCIKV